MRMEYWNETNPTLRQSPRISADRQIGQPARKDGLYVINNGAMPTIATQRAAVNGPTLPTSPKAI
ncbi:hypothetical protein GCM10023088_16490 [Actinomadura verrucosospora]